MKAFFGNMVGFYEKENQRGSRHSSRHRTKRSKFWCWYEVPCLITLEKKKTWNENFVYLFLVAIAGNCDIVWRQTGCKCYEDIWPCSTKVTSRRCIPFILSEPSSPVRYNDMTHTHTHHHHQHHHHPPSPHTHTHTHMFTQCLPSPYYWRSWQQIKWNCHSVGNDRATKSKPTKVSFREVWWWKSTNCGAFSHSFSF